ncbi:hypothetical protein CK203_075048 [Vitis vinifera]|uniref:Uncharacterized protein n=1 Tax=Vitis vinifera TaxID=29760 RepID=A0A438F9M2_VITVI|nr:hypothetical protein CK203_075048 [Vitis vinifera]
MANVSGKSRSNSIKGHDILPKANREIFPQVAGSYVRIPQLDGPIPDPYEDVLSTPNIYNYQGVVNEDYNIVNTPAPNDIQAGTPAVGIQNDVGDDDDDEPPLNENDDDDLDDVDQGEELNTQHLVLAQFDKVTRTKSKWKCTLKDGIMHINNKDILFNKVSYGTNLLDLQMESLISDLLQKTSLPSSASCFLESKYGSVTGCSLYIREELFFGLQMDGCLCFPKFTFSLMERVIPSTLLGTNKSASSFYAILPVAVINTTVRIVHLTAGFLSIFIEPLHLELPFLTLCP